MSSHIRINNQKFRVYIEGDEKRQVLSLYLYPPYSVMEGKFVDACMLFNFFNDAYQFTGRISVSDDGTIRYKEFIDVENIEPKTAMIFHMLDCGIVLFQENNEAFAAVALTRKTYEAIRDELDKKHNEFVSQRSDESGTP
ncbi:MAG: hypothetical protein WCG19_09035 [Chlorobiaceae bacterium]